MSEETVKCQLCGTEMYQVTHSHLKKHHTLSLREYKKQFPGVPTRSLLCINRSKRAGQLRNEKRKGVPRTKETKLKISQTKLKLRYAAWNRGIPRTEEQKQQASEIMKEGYKSGRIIHWNTGNKTALLTKERIRKTAEQQERIYSKESKHKREQTLHNKREEGWIHPNTLTYLEQSTNKRAKELFLDRDWLYNQHITNKRTLSSICVELGLDINQCGGLIARQCKRLQIPIQRWTGKISAQQIEIEHFLDELNVEYITNTRKIIPPLELDIFIPDFNMAIEYNGLYWHSEAAGKTADYHLLKTLKCKALGIRLIHIFEDEWRDKKQMCKASLRHFFGKSPRGVYARNTNIREITWKQAKLFLNEHHLLGAGTSGNYRIGAFDNSDNLIGVMVFGIQNNEHTSTKLVELRRFVTNKNNNPGLGSKMFNHAVRERKYSTIIAFIDQRWFTGLVKQFIGFSQVDVTKPAIWWTDGKTREHRRVVNKKQLVSAGFDTNLSKREIMEKLGFSRIWDCGKLKLEWRQHNT